MHSLDTLTHPVVAAILRQAPDSPARVACAWRLAVGSELARVTRVTCRDDVVVVHLDDDRWLPQLRDARAVVVERLQAALGAGSVTRLEFDTPGTPPRSRRRRTRTHGTEESP